MNNQLNQKDNKEFERIIEKLRSELSEKEFKIKVSVVIFIHIPILITLFVI